MEKRKILFLSTRVDLLIHEHRLVEANQVSGAWECDPAATRSVYFCAERTLGPVGSDPAKPDQISALGIPEFEFKWEQLVSSARAQERLHWLHHPAPESGAQCTP